MFRLTTCFTEIQSWYASIPTRPIRLKLNASKTKLILFYRHPMPNSHLLHTTLNLGPDCSIKPADVVRDLGVHLDNSLYMKNQIPSRPVKNPFFHLRLIRQVKKSLDKKCIRTLVGYIQILVISRIDYFN